MLTLLIREPRIGLQILKRNDALLRQRAECADKDVRPRNEQAVKRKLLFPKSLPQYGFIEAVQIQDPHLTSQLGYIIKQLIGLCLADAKVVFLSAVPLQKINKRFYCKGIVLCGHTEPMPDLCTSQIPFLYQIGLLYHLTGIAQKLFSLCRKKNSPVCTLENCDTQLIFELFNRRGQAGLRDIKLFGSFTDGSGRRRCHDIF